MADGVASRWNGVSYTAQNERRIQGSLLTPAGSYRGRAGRRPGPGLTLTVGGSPEAATLTAGVGVVNTGSDADGSFTFALNTATRNLAARPSAGTSRIDLVIVRILDADIPALATGLKEVNMEIVTGAPGASPVAPGAPAGSTILFQLTVPASGVVAIQDVSTFAVAAGGVLPVRTTAERNALTPYAGLVVFNMETKNTEGYDGTAWGRVPGLAKGKISRASGLTIPNSTTTLCDFTVVDYANNLTADVSAGNESITITRAGVYRVTGGGIWAGSISGIRALFMNINASGQLTRRHDVADPFTVTFGQTVMYEGLLAIGDVLTLSAQQTSGGSLGLTNAYLAVAEIA